MIVPTAHRELRLTDDFRVALEAVLRARFFDGYDADYLASDKGQFDIEKQLQGRMLDVEQTVIPWITEVYDLSEKTVLEIGCGTGSTTVPIALRSGFVHTCDIHEPSIEVAQRRAELLGVDNVAFQLLAPTWAQSEANIQGVLEDYPQVDVLLMMALLEHLTVEERINVLRHGWNQLKPGGILVIYETPNRLNYMDWHSYLMPFFDTLPDQLALAYGPKTSRPFFGVEPGTVNPVERLYRLGRGVSYHEFELALDLAEVDVRNDGFSSYLQHHQAMEHPAFDQALRQIFQQYLPQLPLGFTKPSLDLVLRKSTGQAAETTAPSAPSREQLLASYALTDHREAHALTVMTADRDRLWQEIQQWHTGYEQGQGALTAVTADRDRLWQEVQQWHTGYEQGQGALTAMTADRDRLWQEVQQWHAQVQDLQRSRLIQWASRIRTSAVYKRLRTIYSRFARS